MPERDALTTAGRAAQNVLKMMTGHLATVAVLTVSGILIPRVLGVESYGKSSAVLAVVAILQAASTLGLPQVGVRFLSPLWPADQPQALALGSTIWTIHLALVPLLGVAGYFWLGATVAAEEGRWTLLALGTLCALRPAQEATRIFFLPLGHVGKLTLFELLHALARLPIVLATYLAWGLAGTFVVLPLLQAVVWGATTVTLRRVFPLRFALFRWSVLKPHLAFAGWAFVDTGSSMIHVQLSIYAVAAWSTNRAAGVTAVAIHLYLLVRNLYVAAHRSLRPLLAELEVADEARRLCGWSELMMR